MSTRRLDLPVAMDNSCDKIPFCCNQFYCTNSVFVQMHFKKLTLKYILKAMKYTNKKKNVKFQIKVDVYVIWP